MEIFHEFYQLLFFASIFYIIKLVIVFALKFKAFRRAYNEGEEDKAKAIMLRLTKEEMYLLAVSVGIFFSYLT